MRGLLECLAAGAMLVAGVVTLMRDPVLKTYLHRRPRGSRLGPTRLGKPCDDLVVLASDGTEVPRSDAPKESLSPDRCPFDRRGIIVSPSSSGLVELSSQRTRSREVAERR